MVRKGTNKVFTYCEGDQVLQTCETPDEFIAEITKIKTWNIDNNHKFKGIDCMLNPVIEAAFVGLGLKELLH